MDWAKSGLVGIRRYGFYVIAVAGFLVHGGTALLRLNTFFPSPKLVDFGAFYASSSALRSGLSPYGLPEAWLAALCRTRDIPFRPPAVYNPPFWLWLVQPFTRLSYPWAAWCWTLLNLALLAWCVWELTRLAGCTAPFKRLLGAGLVLTFGPVFLDLTLGQTSILLLAACLVVGQALARPSRTGVLTTGTAHGIAFGAKVFPLAWAGMLFLLRRWRMAVVSVLCSLLVILVGYAVAPEASAQYWSQTLLVRITASSETPGIDDQSLISWLDRWLLPQEYSVPGLRVNELTRVTWTPPWPLSRTVSHALGYGLLSLMTAAVLYVAWRAPNDQHHGAYFLWVLCMLILLPHMERYNHSLLLPAMAWLWARGSRQRGLVVIAYALAGLARLNHLWVIALPAPWAPLATGFGVVAALLLMGGVAVALRQCSQPVMVTEP